jgi:hypothetical protein
MITACGRVETNSGTGSPAAGAAAAAGDAASAETLVAVSVGEDFACALTASGAVRCWDNRGGQLGSNGAGAYRAVAVPVPGLASGVTAISVGGSSACALTAAGGVQCWGDNGSGQLGSGSTRMSSAVPLPVTGLESGVAAISVGATYACALTTAGGVQCWGMLGIGFDIKIPVVATPAPVAGLESGVAAISVGADSACALSTQGGVQCWGYAHTVHPSYSAVPVPIAGLTAGISAVSVGSQTACALTVGGLVECWGYDRPLAPLGPVAVAGLSSGVAAISVGSGSACALTVGGQVECWGNTSQSGYAYPPIPVTGLASSVTAVSVGQYSTCVVVSDGVECWGLGDPRPVVGLAGPRDAAGTDGGVSGLGDSGNTECADPLTFADPDVDLFVRYAIGIPSGPIHAADVANLTALSLSFPYSPTYTTPPTDIDYVDPPRPYDGLVTSLAGVDCIPSLRSLGVNAFLVDLTPLGRLPKLSLLGFGQAFETSFPPMPQVANLSATVYQNTAKILAAFSSVRVLSLSNADFSTAEARAALSALTNLTMLDLRSAGLTDTTLLAPLSHLADVELSANQIQDLSSLSSLPGLRTLDLSFNQITDLAPLVANLALGYGTAISITDNPPLDCAAQRGNIATLRARGVTVDTDCP